MSEEAKKTSWFKGVKAEFNRIIWPTKETLKNETVTVVCVTVVLGILITLIDIVVRTGIEFIIR